MTSRIYIGIDDTDNLSSRGTGFIARELGKSLEKEGLIRLHSIVRHQLLKDERIPYTSHNSSASIVGFTEDHPDRIIEYSEEFLYNEHASGSDVGLCVAKEENITTGIEEFGILARKVVLDKEQAHLLADSGQVYLRGLTGKKIGVIGALAAAGLRRTGNDGRLLWLRNLRETAGLLSVGEYLRNVPVDLIEDMEGNKLGPETKIEITGWCRPVMRNGKIILLAEKTNGDGKHLYRSASKELIKGISE